MGEKKFQKLLKQSFPISNKESWKRTATVEVNGNEPFTHLSWKNEDGATFFPYYDEDDNANIEYLQNFQLQSPKESFVGNRAWLNVPEVTVTNEVTNNKRVLEHLQNGADGVLFNLSLNSTPDLEKLLQDVHWHYCSISFYGVSDSFLSQLKSFVARKKMNLDSAQGNFFWNTLPLLQNDVFSFSGNIKALGIVVPSSTPVHEIVYALVSGVKLIENFQHTAPVEKVISSISFSFSIGADFFSTVAKLKALRLLWFQVARAYRLEKFIPEHFHVHARSEKWISEKYQPHSNMLKSTTAAVAAIAGGCNSLTILPEDEDNIMMDRIARNVTNILREESHLEKVADPLAGAYMIDIMIDRMARQAWSQFQSTMAK